MLRGLSAWYTEAHSILEANEPPPELKSKLSNKFENDVAVAPTDEFEPNVQSSSDVDYERLFSWEFLLYWLVNHILHACPVTLLELARSYS